MHHLEFLIKELKFYALRKNHKVVKISHATTYWHILHSIQVIVNVVEAMEQSVSKQFKPKFSWIKFGVMFFKYIPRGKGKAPKIVIPNNEVEPEVLNKYFLELDNSLQKLAGLTNHTFFRHPIFGDLIKKDSIKFLEIHTQHHLKIIKDICFEK